MKEVMRRLPGRGAVYFGDTARTPYGTKSPELVRKYAVEDAGFLVGRGAKVIVVACNTASALAIDAVREAYDVPVFEVVTPALRRAAAVTRGKVGVIGTTGTVRSGVYERGMRALRPDAAVASRACPLFVPLVEEGWAASAEARSIAKTYIRPLNYRKIDTLILGCTHYPFLRSVIRRAAGPDVRLVDPAKETVKELERYLADHPALDRALRRDRAYRFYVSDRTDRFEAIAAKWLGTDIRLEVASADGHGARRPARQRITT